MTTILLASDLSERSNRALRRALLLARQAGADLVVVHVVDDDQPARMIEMERREAAAILAETIASARAAADRDPQVRIATGEPFDGILRTARDTAADLIVMGAHRRRLLSGVFAGTTVERVIRHGDVPVLMVNMDPATPYLHVLAATDLGLESVRAIRLIERLGILPGARLGLLHAFDPVAKGLLALSVGTEEASRLYVEDERRDVRDAVHDWLHRNGLPSPEVIDLAEGAPAAQIVAASEQGAWDLVALGTKGRTGLPLAVFGSVAEEVLGRLDRDVLAVPPKMERCASAAPAATTS